MEAMAVDAVDGERSEKGAAEASKEAAEAEAEASQANYQVQQLSAIIKFEKFGLVIGLV